MRSEAERLLEKLKRVQKLHESASTPGEKEAAARAIIRIVLRILEAQESKPAIQKYELENFG